MAVNLEQIGARLRFYMKVKELGIYELGATTNTSSIQISKILSGKNYNMDDLLAVLKGLPELNTHWVIYGEGNMFKGDPALNQAHDSKLINKNRARHIMEMQKLMAEIDAMEKSKDSKNQLTDLKARILQLTKEL
jgi:hypothetical protein